MEYIHSKDIFLLMRDTLKLVDRKSMDHGSRVAYYLYKMLECKGGYEKFELADFVFLASLHDIGAYKTENLKDMLQYEFRETMAHSVYGYLVFKNLSPLSELAQIILYHHMDYSQIVTMDYEYKDITACLNLAEKIDIYSTILGDKFDMRRFEKHIGTILSKESFDLFRESVEKYDVLNKVKSGEYKAELDDIAGYMIFTNADKKKSLEMLMYSQGFKGESLVFSAVTGTCIAEILGQKAGLNELEREQLYYGALLHDIGKSRQYEEGIPHETASAALAERILSDMPSDLAFTAEEQLQILTAIRGHRKPRSGAGPLESLLYKSDKMSRICFACPAEPECNWDSAKKNTEIQL